MLLTLGIYGHTGIVEIDEAGTDMFNMKYRPSVGQKYQHYATAEQEDMKKQGGYEAATSKTTLKVNGGIKVYQGFVNDNADLLPDFTPPPANELMSVKSGQSIEVVWTTNGHQGAKMPITFHYNPAYTSTTPVTPKYFSDNPEHPELSQANQFASVAMSDLVDKSGAVKCKDNIGQADYDKAVGKYPGNNKMLCQASIKLPATLKPGLQKIIMAWYADFNPIMFFDAIYVNVGGTGAPATPSAPAYPTKPAPKPKAATPVVKPKKTTVSPAIGKCNK